jgi:hypothetical protein
MKRHSASRLGKYKESDWQPKIEPLFLRLTDHLNGILRLQYSGSSEDRQRAEQLKASFPPDLLKEVRRQWQKRKEENHPFLEPMLTLGGLDVLPVGTDLPREKFYLFAICFLRTGKTINELKAEIESGNANSAKKWLRVQAAFYDLISGKVRFDQMRFKWDMHHLDLMAMGLSYGVASLNGNELADCFDAICLCRKTHHPENLKKLRHRIIRKLEGLKKKASNS